MAENGAAEGTGQPQVQMNILGQFIRDLSFENVMAQKGVGGEVQPDVNVQVALDAKKRSTENQYEVITKLTIESKNKAGGEVLRFHAVAHEFPLAHPLRTWCDHYV